MLLFATSRRSRKICFSKSREEVGVIGETLRQAQGKSLNLYGQHRAVYRMVSRCRDYKPTSEFFGDRIVRSFR